MILKRPWALGRRPVRLIRAATMSGPHGRMMLVASQPDQAGAHSALGRAGVAD